LPPPAEEKAWTLTATFRGVQRRPPGFSGGALDSVVKRRHGLDRCRYKGFIGMKRWVSLGVIADNVVNIGRAIEQQTVP
jgi:transposase, IS5 family